MKKYLSITSIILGLFSSIILLYGLSSFESIPVVGLLQELLEWLTSSSYVLFPLLIGTIGFILSVMALTKYKTYNKKFLSIIGLILNIVPAFLFSILLLIVFLALFSLLFMTILY